MTKDDQFQSSSYTSRTFRFVTQSSKSVLRRTGLDNLNLWAAKSNPESRNDNDNNDIGVPTLRSNANSPNRGRRRSEALVTSSYLYLTRQIHPKPISYPIVVVSLSELANIPSIVSDEEVYDMILRKLEPWIGEEGHDGSGYVLIVLAAEEDGVEIRRGAGIRWWAGKWRRIPRKYRKNLKRLVCLRSPRLTIKEVALINYTLVPLLIPFISIKSYTKFHPLQSFLQLYYTHNVPLKGISLTLAVLHEESRIMKSRPDLFPPVPSSSFSSYSTVKAGGKGKEKANQDNWGIVGSVYGTARSILAYSPLSSVTPPNPVSAKDVVSESSGSKSSLVSNEQPTGAGYWGRRIEELLIEGGGRIKLVEDICQAIIEECSGTEGIFRRTSNSSLLPVLTILLSLPINQQPTIPWTDIAREDPLLPPKILLRFLAQLAEPLVPQSLYSIIRHTTTVQNLGNLVCQLPSSSLTILKPIISTLHTLSKEQYSKSTKMSSLGLSIVLSPSLINGPDVREDAALCLEPGKGVSAALASVLNRGESSIEEHGHPKDEGGTLVGVLEMWIREYDKIQL